MRERRRRAPPSRLGIAEAEEPGLRRLAIELARKLGRLFPLVGVGRDLALRESPGVLAQRGVLLGLEDVAHGGGRSHSRGASGKDDPS